MGLVRVTWLLLLLLLLLFRLFLLFLLLPLLPLLLLLVVAGGTLADAAIVWLVDDADMIPYS